MSLGSYSGQYQILTRQVLQCFAETSICVFILCQFKVLTLCRAEFNLQEYRYIFIIPQHRIGERSWNLSPLKEPLIFHGKCHGCWCPSDAMRQGINRHGVDLATSEHSGFCTNGLKFSLSKRKLMRSKYWWSHTPCGHVRRNNLGIKGTELNPMPITWFLMTWQRYEPG